MKIHTYIALTLGVVLMIAMSSCSDNLLDKEPMSTISPEKYYSSESQLEAAILDEYPHALPGHSGAFGAFGGDLTTDNQIQQDADGKYTPTLWKVGLSNGNWRFERIYRINFLLQNAFGRYGEDPEGSENTIAGDLGKIKHIIGEAYFLRAWDYFTRLKKFGDFPIITEPLPDDFDVLVEASKRKPRNEVARFILEDLDRAATFMQDKDFGSTRISRTAALLVKSRVALYEATWLKYFKGTAFVPGGEGWPGAAYNSNFSYPSGSIDNEIIFFLEQAMSSAKEVGDKYLLKLTNNTGYMQQSVDEPSNDYFDMFAAEDMSRYPEIILWRQYAKDILNNHNVPAAAGRGNNLVGMTRQYVQNFLMQDGLPVYAHGTYTDGDGYYLGDKTIHDVRVNRDTRLSIFLKEPGQYNVLYELDNTIGTEAQIVEPYPAITSGDGERGYSTGYAVRKGGNLNRKYYENYRSFTGAPILRAAEALLNYMEASYELNGKIDATADSYWRALRRRAHVDEDYQKTINATDMSKEAENDWGAYSAGQILSDPTLYNIRRERRSEFISEGYRTDDLHRWRAYDQLITTPCHLEGIHLWNTPMTAWYNDENGNTTLKYDQGTESNVSSPNKSEYLRPFEKNDKQNAPNGLTWKMAHYLDPLPIEELLITSPSGQDASQSVIYQNPYWPIAADVPAER